MVLFRYYDKDNRIDKAWYDSSNIIYSECDDNVDDFKTLRIVFKRGEQYEYKKVDVNDYLMFLNGGLDGSNGKAFFKYIKPKYEFEKLTPVDLEFLKTEMERYKELKKTEEENKENKSEA